MTHGKASAGQVLPGSVFLDPRTSKLIFSILRVKKGPWSISGVSEYKGRKPFRLHGISKSLSASSSRGPKRHLTIQFPGTWMDKTLHDPSSVFHYEAMYVPRFRYIGPRTTILTFHRMTTVPTIRFVLRVPPLISDMLHDLRIPQPQNFHAIRCLGS